MRGESDRQAHLMLAETPELFVPEAHPLRRIKPIVEAALRRMSRLFNELYAERGRPSIPPEQLLKASLLVAPYSVRAERQFCEQLRYNILFRWFLDLNLDEAPFNASTLSKNRQRLLDAEATRAFPWEVVAEARRRQLLAADHFTVDGTLIEAWASQKSYRPRDEREPPSCGGRKLRYIGRERNRLWLEFTAAAYNLVRLAQLETVAA